VLQRFEHGLALGLPPLALGHPFAHRSLDRGLRGPVELGTGHASLPRREHARQLVRREIPPARARPRVEASAGGLQGRHALLRGPQRHAAPELGLRLRFPDPALGCRVVLRRVGPVAQVVVTVQFVGHRGAGRMAWEIEEATGLVQRLKAWDGQGQPAWEETREYSRALGRMLMASRHRVDRWGGVQETLAWQAPAGAVVEPEGAP